MTTVIKPHFTINNRFQKSSDLYSNFLTHQVLKDICKRITGLEDFSVEFVDAVNVGKLILLQYQNTISYVMVPDLVIKSRNSYFQSFPSSIVRFYNDTAENKNIYFYFLPSRGNNTTDYFKFMYRIMATAGVKFLNTSDFLSFDILPFTTFEDIIASRELLRNRNSSNNSTQITKNSDNIIEVFGKTYGASKKETTILCIALSNIIEDTAKLYIICEQNLTNLPAPDLAVIKALGKFEVIPTDLTMERRALESTNNLRSARFIYNLLSKLGPKKCAFCECDIPQLIQGAHIWPVASIKKEHQLTLEEKLNHATSKDNGIWLCENHHKLFDENLLTIENSGKVKFSNKIAETSLSYLTNSTPKMVLNPEIVNENVEFYITKPYS